MNLTCGVAIHLCPNSTASLSSSRASTLSVPFFSAVPSAALLNDFLRETPLASVFHVYLVVKLLKVIEELGWLLYAILVLSSDYAELL